MTAAGSSETSVSIWATVVASYGFRLEPSPKRFGWTGTCRIAGWREDLWMLSLYFSSQQNNVEAFRTTFEQYCPELKPAFRSSVIYSVLKCIFRKVIHFTSRSVLLPFAWGNEFVAEIMHVDQQQMKARQNAVCKIAGIIISDCT